MGTVAMNDMPIPLKATWGLITSATQSWVDDYASSMGAALAYYTLFSLAPLLLIVIALAGLVFGPDAARGEILGQLRELMGEEGARAVQAMLEAANQPGKGAAATVAGVVFLLIGATSVFVELQYALDRIWRAPVRLKSSGLWRLLRSQLLSFGMILCLGFLLMVSLVASAALAAMGKWWGPVFAGWELLGNAINVSLDFAMTSTGFALIYKIMPRVRIRWLDVWIGAVVTALLFTIGKLLIGVFIGKSGVTSVFGAAASLAVVLIWVYYSAQIFLMGAEFTWVYAHTFGSLKEQPMAPAQSMPSRAQTAEGAAGSPPNDRRRPT
jgi:membrane protein